MLPKTGDLIFTQIGSADGLISTVTEGHRGARVDHVGVIVENARGTYVLEAFPPEVRLTNLEVHIRRTRAGGEGVPRYMLARLEPQHRHLIDAAIASGIAQRDKPYDRFYGEDDDALYCSELVVDMFKEANGGQPFFPESRMRFLDDNGVVPEGWRTYFAYFGVDVPIGERGSNPAALSRDDKLEIYKVVGPITGYRDDVRIVEGRDRRLLQRVLKNAVGGGPDTDTMVASLLSENRPFRVWVALRGEEVLGSLMVSKVVSLSTNTQYQVLHDLWVDPSAHWHSVVTDLLRDVALVSRAEGVRALDATRLLEQHKILLKGPLLAVGFSEEIRSSWLDLDADQA